MHGMIFAQLKKYVDVKVGGDAWRKIVAESKVPTKMYLPVRPYDDAELIALVETASRLTSTPVPVLLRDYGAFVVTDLLHMYRAFLKPEWRTLDVIENTESKIHTRVRDMTKGAMPPFLEATRVSPRHVRVDYRSKRRLCPLAEGLIDGIAAHYGERVQIEHSRCMHRGNEHCELNVRAA